MDKAARMVRRSSARLLSLSAGHSDLNVVISEFKSVKSTAKAFLAAQQSAADYLMRWAMHEENKSLKDACSHMVELSTIWAEVQKEFIERLKAFRKMFDLIMEGEKHVDAAKHTLHVHEQKENKIRKELRKAYKKGSTEELYELNNRLRDVMRQKTIAQISVDERLRENEAAKSIRFKEGLRKHSQAYIELGEKCVVVYEAHEELGYALPDVYERDQASKYRGSESGRQSVSRARNRVKLYRRQPYSRAELSSTPRRYFPEPQDGEAPPPYTPSHTPSHTYHSPDSSTHNDSSLVSNLPTNATRPSQSLSLTEQCNPFEENIQMSRSASEPFDGGASYGEVCANIWVSRRSPDGNDEESLSGAVGGLGISSTV